MNFKTEAERIKTRLRGGYFAGKPINELDADMLLCAAYALGQEAERMRLLEEINRLKKAGIGGKV